MTSTATCPICTSGTAEEFLRRDRVAVHQNLVVNTAAAARDLGVGSLSMCACGNCGFVFNADFDAGLLDYGQRYDNTQTLSPTFAAHVDDRVRHLVESCGVRGATIVEVGCGKGDFLKRLVQADGGNSGWGFDPTYDGPDSLFDGRVRFRREFYDERQSPIRADIVICRHVIEHIQQPLALLQKVRRALADTPQARVFFETPCVEWILDQQVTWDFFYEHCSLFSRSSLTRAFVFRLRTPQTFSKGNTCGWKPSHRNNLRA